MPARCAALQCSNTQRQGFCLVRFPKDETRRAKWVKAMGRNGWKPAPSHRICEVHFKLSDWLDHRKLLNPSAVPSVFCLDAECLHSASVSSPVEGVIIVEPSESVAHSPHCPISITTDLHHVSSIRKDSEASSEKCVKIQQENIQLQSDIIKLKQSVSDKQKSLVKTEETVRALRDMSNIRERWLTSKLGTDQIRVAEVGNAKGVTWTPKTVQKALEMKISGGSAGLKTANDVVFPLPSVRTVQRRTEMIKFQPGLLFEFLDPFAAKVVPMFATSEKDCALHFDEMAIKKQNCFDPGTGEYIGNVTLPGVDGAAEKLEIFTFAGLQGKWKLNAAYHLNPAQSCTVQRADVVRDLLSWSEEGDLNCIALICDMGNRGMLAELGFDTTKDGMRYSIAHPFNADKVLYIIPDIVHVFKSAKEMILSNKEASLSEDIMNRFSLPSRIVKLEHIEWLVDFQEDMDVKFAPRLAKKDLGRGHFSKMNTASACHIFSDKSAAALNFLVETKVFVEECKTSAWFLDLMNKWFNILTSRSLVCALSLRNKEAYDDAIGVLNLVMEVFLTLDVGGQWKPVQTHLVMATQALLEVQHFLLFDRKYDFLFVGRFANDISESEMAQIRIKRPTPTALEAKYTLKENTLSQCSRKVRKSQYGHDDRMNLLNLEDITNFIEENYASVSSTVSKVLLWTCPDELLKDYKMQGHVLYRMCGYLLHSMRKNGQIKCDSCFNQLQNQGDVPHPKAYWTIRTDFKEGAQVQVSAEVYDLLYAIDYNLKKWRCELMKLKDMQNIVIKSIAPGLQIYNLSTCHDLKETITTRFVVMRLKQMSTTMPTTESKGYHLASKSMGYRLLASQYTPNKRLRI